MARKRRNSRPWWITLPMWVVVAALVGWGLWQAAEFRRSITAEVRASSRAVDGAATENAAVTEPAATQEVQGNADTAPDGGTGAGGDPWAAETTQGVPLLDDGQPAKSGNGAAATQSAEAGLSADELLARGAKLLDEGKLVAARTALNAALAALGDEERAGPVREQLAGMNAGVFLGPDLWPDDPVARLVDIQPGDSFLKLGRTYGIPASLLQALNPGLNPRNLKPLTGIKIVQGPFNVRIFKRAGRIDLYARDIYVRSFAGQGEDGNYLPVGTYKVSAGAKIHVDEKAWIGFEGIAEGTRDVTNGWLYGLSGPRMTRREDRVSGVKMQDVDLWQLYNVLMENRSLLKVEP